MPNPASSIVTAGNTALATDYNNLRTDALFQYPLVLNNSGSTLAVGDVVIWDASADKAVKLTTNFADPRAAGVIIQGGANGTNVYLAPFGATVTINVQGNVTRGHSLVTSTTTNRAADSGGGGSTPGMIGWAMTGYGGGGAGTVTALVVPTLSRYGGAATQVNYGTGTFSWGSVPGDTAVISNFVVSGNNRLLVVISFVNSSNGGTGTIKFGGVQLTNQIALSPFNTNEGIAIYTLLAPNVSTANITFATNAGSGNCRLVAILLNDVNQSTPIGTGASATATSTGPSVTATVIPGDYCVGSFLIVNAADTPSARGAGQSIVDGPNLATPTANTNETDKVDPALGVSQTFSWTVPNSAIWGAVALAIHPV